MFGGMTSFPLALVGGIVVGVVDQLVLANSTDTPGLNKLVMFLLLIVLVLVRGRSESTGRAGLDAHRHGRAPPGRSSPATRWPAPSAGAAWALLLVARARASPQF